MNDPIAEPSWIWLKRRFATTRWSLVKRLKRPSEGMPASSEELCRLYWHPLYAFLRRTGHSEADAQDHVQSFMVRVVHGRLLETVDEARGKFRTFLLTLLLRQVSSEKTRCRSQKRGGGVVTVPLDWACAETMRLAEAGNTVSPEDTFRRSFAVRLVDEAMISLRARYAEIGQSALFDELVPALEGPLVDDSYESVAHRLRMSENAVRTAVFRMRQRFRETLRSRAAAAWGMPQGPALDAELRELFG